MPQADTLIYRPYTANFLLAESQCEVFHNAGEFAKRNQNIHMIKTMMHLYKQILLMSSASICFFPVANVQLMAELLGPHSPRNRNVSPIFLIQPLPELKLPPLTLVGFIRWYPFVQFMWFCLKAVFHNCLQRYKTHLPMLTEEPSQHDESNCIVCHGGHTLGSL